MIELNQANLVLVRRWGIIGAHLEFCKSNAVILTTAFHTNINVQMVVMRVEGWINELDGPGKSKGGKAEPLI